MQWGHGLWVMPPSGLPSPTGCCNRSHNVVFSLSDIMMQQPTGLALRMGDALARLQAEEGAHHAHGAPMGERGCPYLTATGCTLYLFKSPLCVHYLCPTVAAALEAAHGAGPCPSWRACAGPSTGSCNAAPISWNPDWSRRRWRCSRRMAGKDAGWKTGRVAGGEATPEAGRHPERGDVSPRPGVRRGGGEGGAFWRKLRVA